MVNSRFMRIMIIFDLPTIESYEQKEYRQFRKELIKNGYVMIQFSVYLKSFNHQISLNEEIVKISKRIPKSGNIRAISLTEHQWSNAIFMCGEKQINEIVNNNERFNKI